MKYKVGDEVLFWSWILEYQGTIIDIIDEKEKIYKINGFSPWALKKEYDTFEVLESEIRMKKQEL